MSQIDPSSNSHPIRALGAIVGIVLVALLAVGAVIALRGTGQHTGTAAYSQPAIESGAAMAYDPDTKTVILFGGRGKSDVLSDTWSWDGTGWTKLAPTTSPPARSGASVGWDPVSQRLVLFGGVGSGTTSSASVCTANPLTPTVTNITGTIASSPPVLPSGAPVPINQPVCQIQAAPALTDTWTFDGRTWRQEHPSAVSTIEGTRLLMATDSAHGTLMLLAETATACSATASCTTAATQPNYMGYLWTDGNWVPAQPLSGDVEALTTDPLTGAIAAFAQPAFAIACSGTIRSGAIGTSQTSAPVVPCPLPAVKSPISSPVAGTVPLAVRVSEWDGQGWKTIETTGDVPNFVSAAVSDTTHNQIVVLTPDGGTFTLSGGHHWSKASAVGPTGTGWGAIANDLANGTVVLLTQNEPRVLTQGGPIQVFGGGGVSALTVPNIQNSTWVWSGAAWTVDGVTPTPAPSLSPPVCAGQAMPPSPLSSSASSGLSFGTGSVGGVTVTTGGGITSCGPVVPPVCTSPTAPTPTPGVDGGPVTICAAGSGTAPPPISSGIILATP